MTMANWIVMACAILALGIAPITPPRVSAAGETLIVVAGLSFPRDDISMAELKNAFRGQRILLSGKAIVPVNHPIESPQRVTFDRIALGLEPSAVGRFWVDMRIRDQGRPPLAASTPELALRIAAALPGALTYTTRAAHTGKWPLKVLTIDGKTDSQASYPLKR